MERKEYNYNKLKGLIKEHCGTQSNFALALGIGTATLSDKLSNKRYFNQMEIEKTKEIFNLSAEDVDLVFYTAKG